MPGIRPPTLSTSGMIATPHYLASAAGLRILNDGGSAMDAVIAANAVLTVLYPDQTAIGGDCFFIVFDASNGDVRSFNGSGPAGHLASAGALRDAGTDRMPAKGPLTITVPGTIDAWVQGHERYGKLPFARLLGPAIAHARDGFPVSPRLAQVLAYQQDLIRSWPALARLVYPGGNPPVAGTTLRFPDLARSLGRIATHGRDSFYQGEIANAIASTIAGLGGWLDEKDLANYRGEWVDTVSRDYRDITVHTARPNSQGIAVLMELGMLEFNSVLDGWGGAEGVHRQITAAGIAYGQRNLRVADPSFVDIDTKEMLSDAFLRELWAEGMGESRAPAGRGDGDTVYLCAVDRDGNAVSLIQSLFGAFGSCVVAGDTGIILQNRGTSFSLRDDDANLLQPGKRPMHTLMPSMLINGGTLVGPVGTQGGDAQAQIQLQLLANLLDFGMDPQGAIDAARWIAIGAGTGGPSRILVETGFEAATIGGLGARGHDVTVIDPWNPGAGHAQMIVRDNDRGVLIGGVDPRADGVALGQ